MFWRFGGYANISTIDTILDKPDFQLEDLLDESDLIQELKQHNTKLIEYLREPKVLQKLLEYVVTPKLEPVENPEDDGNEEEKKGRSRGLSFGRPRASSRTTSDGTDEDEVEKKRNRYAYVAAEVLSSDNWSIYEALMESRDILREFWNFLKHPSPLDPLQASYFTKVNEALFDKKTEEMLTLLRSLDDAIPNMLRHVDCPMIMDLLLKIISLERTDSGQGIVEVCRFRPKGDLFLTQIANMKSNHVSGSIRKTSCRPCCRSSDRNTIMLRRPLLVTLSKLSSLFLPTLRKTNKLVLVQMSSHASWCPNPA